jgi:uncharacterized RDD family membrane protein YckC
MLPKIFICKHCNEEIELDDNEISFDEIICPSCNISLHLEDTLATHVSRESRFKSMFIDYTVMGVVFFIFSIPVFVYSELHPETMSIFHTGLRDIYGLLNYIALFGFALYFCKDLIEGRSFAKRYVKHVIVDNKTGKMATPIQTLVRNAFIPLWFIEVIVVFISPSRRIGDFVAKTKVVHYEPSQYEKKKGIIGQIIISFVIAYVSLIIFWELMISGITG